MKSTILPICVAAALYPLIPMTDAAEMTAQATELNQDEGAELALLDAVATGLGSLDSWLRSEPEAALGLLSDQQALLDFAEERIETLGDGSAAEPRIKDRVAALRRAVKDANGAWERLLDKAPAQVETELARHEGAIERYAKAKSKRPSSLLYVPKAVAETGRRIDQLAAAGVSTDALRKRHSSLEAALRGELAAMDPVARAKAGRAPRDTYKGEDRNEIEAFVQDVWDGATIERVVMPESRWSRTFGARVDGDSGEVSIDERERMTVWVATRLEDSIERFHPVRVEREHFITYGELLGETEPGEMRRIPCDEWSFDALAK